MKRWAGKAYQGVDRRIRVPVRGRRLRRGKQRHYRSHTKICCLVELLRLALRLRVVPLAIDGHPALDGPALIFPAGRWTAFVKALKGGEFGAV